MKVIAFTKYDREAASTRQRILQYIPAVVTAGFEVDHRPLLANDYVRSLATGEHFSRVKVVRSYIRRLLDLLRRPACDLIWVYAELLPYLPGGFEKLVFRSGVPVIYDFDDAFFALYEQHRSGLVRRFLGHKLEPLLAGAAATTCGNSYLRDYAARFCARSLVFPTVVDTDLWRPVHRDANESLTIGWIGSPSTWQNVRPILPMLKNLCEETGARLRVIGAGRNAEPDRFKHMELVPWSEATEVSSVQEFDIGIMPLDDQPFERGKSGYKLIQYMACGAPTVASPVGANRDIMDEGVGFLARTPSEWRQALATLLADLPLRERMGAAARRRAVAHYSLAVHAPRLVELFRDTAAPAGAGR